jgi:Fe-S-cluster containining protein
MNDVPAVVRRIWAEVPDSGCKGLCVEACGPLAVAPVEEAVMGRRGVRLLPPDELVRMLMDGDDLPSCPALVDGRCSIYEDRPLICRLYGSVANLRCEHGCEPAQGFLTAAEAGDLIGRVMDVPINRAGRR